VADDDFLVQVRAQVMTRDDSSGGWLPTNGGGMSVVGVHASSSSPADSHYMIRGRRVCDQAVSSPSQTSSQLLQTCLTNADDVHCLTEMEFQLKIIF